jgi:hypothetical protein
MHCQTAGAGLLSPGCLLVLLARHLHPDSQQGAPQKPYTGLHGMAYVCTADVCLGRCVRVLESRLGCVRVYYCCLPL